MSGIRSVISVDRDDRSVGSSSALLKFQQDTAGRGGMNKGDLLTIGADTRRFINQFYASRFERNQASFDIIHIYADMMQPLPFAFDKSGDR